MHKHLNRKRTLAAAGAVALFLTAGAAAANATPTPSPSPTPTGGVDLNKSGSITIHKHENQDPEAAVIGDPGTSKVLPAPIAGVEFTAYPITSLDLSRNSSWEALSTLRAAADCTVPGQTLGTGIKSPLTNASGIATIQTGKAAAFLVCETGAPLNVVDKSQPFIVSVPYPTNGEWIYDVNVYPKNGLGIIAKSLDPQIDLGLGGKVVFPVSTSVTRIDPNKQFKFYSVEDTFDPRLKPTGVDSVTLGGDDVNQSLYKVTQTGQKVSVGFTTEGLNFLKANATKPLVIKFGATVESPKDGGKIPNIATLHAETEPQPAAPSFAARSLAPAGVVGTSTDVPATPAGHVGITTNEVQTWWGNLLINKVDAHSKHPLQGATFEVYPAKNPYAATCTDKSINGTAPVTISGKTQFTSDSTGVLDFPGVYVSDSENAPIKSPQRCYVVKEVAAPVGYVLPQGDAALTSIAVTPGISELPSVAVPNTQTEVPPLPLTGANGTLLATVGGAALLLVGSGVAVVATARKRRESESAAN